MSISKKEFQKSVQAEINESGDWTRSTILQRDLGAMIETATALNQPIHYVANTSNSDYTVTIGESEESIGETARNFVSWAARGK